VKSFGLINPYIGSRATVDFDEKKWEPQNNIMSVEIAKWIFFNKCRDVWSGDGYK